MRANHQMIHLNSILITAFSTLVLVAGGSCVVMNEANADWSQIWRELDGL